MCAPSFVREQPPSYGGQQCQCATRGTKAGRSIHSKFVADHVDLVADELDGDQRRAALHPGFQDVGLAHPDQPRLVDLALGGAAADLPAELVEQIVAQQRAQRPGVALRERFDEDKIYVFGESWGSILGIWLVQQHPELYHALVTTGQMVAPVENDIEMYDFALQRATELGNTDAVETLRRNGPPPYTRDELIGYFGAMNGIVNDYMHAHAQGEGTGHNLAFDSLAAPEYGLVDKVYWGLSLLNTFPNVYSQLNDVDFRTQATELDVPVYFVKGRWDINASNALTEEYFELLDAPHKELIWFEDSAHTPSWDEPDDFTDVMANTVLAQTQDADR